MSASRTDAQKAHEAAASPKLRARALREFERWAGGPMRVLAFAWLALIFTEFLRPKSHLLSIFGTAIWIIFIAEFGVRFALAPDKRKFLTHNLLTVVALLVPALRMFSFLGVLRVLAAARGGQLVVLIGTMNRTMNSLRAGLQRRNLAFVAVLTIIVAMVGAAAMMAFEPHAKALGQPGFVDYGDALWWTAMLMTTIGSQYWPITSAGRVLAFLLSIYSLGVFGYLTAALSSVFVGEDATRKHGPVAGSEDISHLRQEIASLRDEIASARTAWPGSDRSR